MYGTGFFVYGTVRYKVGVYGIFQVIRKKYLKLSSLQDEKKMIFFFNYYYLLKARKIVKKKYIFI